MPFGHSRKLYLHAHYEQSYPDLIGLVGAFGRFDEAFVTGRLADRAADDLAGREVVDGARPVAAEDVGADVWPFLRCLAAGGEGDANFKAHTKHPGATFAGPAGAVPWQEAALEPLLYDAGRVDRVCSAIADGHADFACAGELVRATGSFKLPPETLKRAEAIAGRKVKWHAAGTYFAFGRDYADRVRKASAGLKAADFEPHRRQTGGRLRAHAWEVAFGGLARKPVFVPPVAPVALHLHAWDKKIALGMLPDLANGFYDEVHVTGPDHGPEFGRTVAAALHGAPTTMHHFPNCGCDVAPFLALTKSRPGRTWVKVHTKSDPEWRRRLVEPLFGRGPQRLAGYFRRLAAGGASLIGGGEWKYPVNFQTSPNGRVNQAAAHRLCRVHDVPWNPHASFIAGTVFLCSAAFANRLGKMGWEWDDFEEGYLKDAGHAHAWERLFGLLAVASEGLVGVP